MASRNVRPRVLAAISELGSFTVPDLVQAAGLADRKAAYAQLSKLSEEGLLEEETLPPAGSHRPLTLYRVKPDPAAREKLAAELAGYRLPAKTAPSSGLAETAVAEANTALNEAEPVVDAMAEGSRDVSRLEQVNALLDSARIDIETALLEHGDTVSEEKTPAHPAIVARNRWRRLDQKAKKLQTEGEIRHQVRPWLQEVLIMATKALAGEPAFAPTVTLGVAIGGLLTRQMTSRLASLQHNARPAVEILLDELRAEKQSPWVPLLRRACRQSDTELLLQVLGSLVQLGEPWVAYDQESTYYLLTGELRANEWLNAYQSLHRRICPPGQLGNAPSRTGLYSFESRSLDPERYMALTKDCRISVVAHSDVPFLGVAELVRPTLTMLRGQTFESLDCGFLRPGAALHAYGPLVHDLHCLPGAPALRVIGSLGLRGVPVEQCLQEVVKNFDNDRSLLVVQPEEHLRTPIDEHVKRVLEAEIILPA